MAKNLRAILPVEELWEDRHSRRGLYWMIEAARESVEREERDGEEDEE